MKKLKETKKRTLQKNWSAILNYELANFNFCVFFI